MFIISDSDASLKRTEFDTGGEFKEFTLGIPVSGFHIEDPGTEYADIVQIFITVENGKIHYIVGITNIKDSDKLSENHRAIWYI